MPPSGFTPDLAILSPCGWGNLGDSAIVESVITAVRRRMPALEIAGLTLNPEDTARRHGIPAFTCSGFDRAHYGVTERVPFADPERRMAPVDETPTAVSNRLEDLLRRASGLRVFRTLRRAGRVIQKDLNHRSLLRPHTGRLRWIVVAGGGQLDDFWGGSFGHPYVLWRWARSARSLGARYVVLSVGTGSLTTPLARFFVQQALALADYRSFRDERSRALLDDRLVENDPVVPDLAYGLPVENLRASPSSARTRAIGFSPIAYCDPRSWPTADKRRYESYLERITAVAVALLERGYSLILYGTDGPDLKSVADLHSALVERVSPALAARIQTPVVRTHDDLLTALAGVEMVVTSRLHGVTLPHLLDIPVLALSYERKVASLMDAMRHQEYCLNIDDFAVSDALERVSAILERRSSLSSEVAERVRGYRMKVEAQYDSLFGQHESRNGGRAE